MARKKRKIADPPAWLAIGARVDYCSVVGDDPTQRDMVVRAGPELLGGHTWVVWLEGKAGCVYVDACLPAKAVP